MNNLLAAIGSGLEQGRVIPFLGAGALPADNKVPTAPATLAAMLTAKVTVPHKIRNNLTAAAQFIENFKHRKTLVKHMHEAFCEGATPGPVHALMASYPALPLIVNLWYDDAVQRAFQSRTNWGLIQAVSRSEHLDQWVRYYNADGSDASEADASGWRTIVYEPWGSVAPADNYLVSDSDFVEVLTEIDIQTPIPPFVQQIRRERSFLFLGCRFNTQIDRNFARQIMKRSAAAHWAVLPEEPTRMEAKFLKEQNIERIVMSVEDFAAAMQSAQAAAA